MYNVYNDVNQIMTMTMVMVMYFISTGVPTPHKNTVQKIINENNK